MKVIDFVNELKKIGYDENTELSFSCIDGESGTWHELHPYKDDDIGPFSYGEDLTGEPYNNDVIDFCLDVDECKDYLMAKTSDVKMRLVEELNYTLAKFEREESF